MQVPLQLLHFNIVVILYFGIYSVENCSKLHFLNEFKKKITLNIYTTIDTIDRRIDTIGLRVIINTIEYNRREKIQ